MSSFLTSSFMHNVFGGLAQFSLFESARLAAASVLATVEYSSLLWAFLLGYAIWGDIPPVATVAGAGLILLAGLLLVASERCAAVSQRPR